jgi:acyl-CoA thioester hydrolase
VQDFRHSIELRARFGDVDMLGHVNNAQYITYVEEARIQYARDVLGWDGTPAKLGLIVARIAIDYLLPLYAGETIRLYTRCTRLGNKSFDLAHIMTRAEDDAVASKIETTLVAYDAATEQSTPIPDAFRQNIIAYEITPPEGAHAT